MPVTFTAVMGRCGGWSSIEASIARQTVSLVHDKSMSSGVQLRRRRSIVASGLLECNASVMRLRAIAPIRSLAGFDGGVVGHHATTGASGTSSGMTSVSGWLIRPPRGRRMMISPAPASAPNRTWAFRLEPLGSFGPSVRSTAGLSRSVLTSAAASAASGSPSADRATGSVSGTTAITRHGCSRLAEFAISSACSRSTSSVAISSVSTRPVADSPRSSCSCSILCAISRVRVFGMSMIMASSNGVRRVPACRRLGLGPMCRSDRLVAGRAWTRIVQSGRGSPS